MGQRQYIAVEYWFNPFALGCSLVEYDSIWICSFFNLFWYARICFYIIWLCYWNVIYWHLRIFYISRIPKENSLAKDPNITSLLFFRTYRSALIYMHAIIKNDLRGHPLQFDSWNLFSDWEVIYFPMNLSAVLHWQYIISMQRTHQVRCIDI